LVLAGGARSIRFRPSLCVENAQVKSAARTLRRALAAS
jgi:acetylornithine/succinyldiaminopimelate/putrescine aminotransferase